MKKTVTVTVEVPADRADWLREVAAALVAGRDRVCAVGAEDLLEAGVALGGWISDAERDLARAKDISAHERMRRTANLEIDKSILARIRRAGSGAVEIVEPETRHEPDYDPDRFELPKI